MKSAAAAVACTGTSWTKILASRTCCWVLATGQKATCLHPTPADFVNGRAAQNFANACGRADARGAIAEWKGFSEKLESKLEITELSFVKAETGRIGFAHLFKTVLEELRRIDPNNPLLQKENKLKILGAKVAEKANEMGYVYDAVSGQIIGKR